MGSPGALFALLLVASAAWTAAPALSSPTAAEYHAWAVEASQNLTKFSSTLLDKVAPLFESEQASDGTQKLERFTKYFPPVITCPPGRPLTVYDEGAHSTEPSKELCKLDTPDCVVYSFGSAGDFGFERNVLKATNCEVHTFDCTYTGKGAPDNSRHKYHKWCVGEPDQPSATQYPPIEGGEYVPYAEVVRRLGHSRVHVLKIDVEGWEFQALGKAFMSWTPGLPEQISMEIHMASAHDISYPSRQSAKNVPQVALFFMHLANLGYGATFYDPNMYNHIGCCAEYSFFRVARHTMPYHRLEQLAASAQAASASKPLGGAATASSTSASKVARRRLRRQG